MIFSVLMTGCGNMTESAEENPDEISDRPKTACLTGMPLSDGESDQKPYMIPIYGSEMSGPAAGLSQAEIVIQYAAINGVTEYIALYSDISAIDQIGPVRQLWMNDTEILSFVQSGICICDGDYPADEEDAVERLVSRGIDVINTLDDTGVTVTNWEKLDSGYDVPYCRNIDTGILRNTISQKGIDMNYSASPVLDFSEETRPKIEVLDFADRGRWTCTGYLMSEKHGNSFLYDDYFGKYYIFRGENDQIISDPKAEQPGPVMFDNILLLSVRYENGRTNCPNELHLYGEGNAFYFVQGRYIKCRWTRNEQDPRYVLSDLNGRELSIYPGRTYISFIDESMEDYVEISVTGPHITLWEEAVLGMIGAVQQHINSSLDRFADFEILSFNPEDMQMNSSAVYGTRMVTERYQPAIRANESVTDDTVFYDIAYRAELSDMVLRPLCSIDGCAHDTPACNAWVPGEYGNPSLVPTEDRLFWVYYDGKPGRIEVTDLNGYGRKTLYKASGRELSYFNNLSYKMVYDGAHLGFMSFSRFILLDTETGEVVKTVNIGKNGTVEAMADGDTVMIMISSAGGTEGIEIFALNIETGKVREVFDFDFGEEHFGHVIPSDSCKVFCYEYKTVEEHPWGDETRMVSGFIYDAVTGEITGIDDLIADGEDIQFIYCEGGSAVVKYSGHEGYEIVDISTGEIRSTAIDVRNNWNEKWPPFVYDGNDEYYLITTRCVRTADFPYPPYYYDMVAPSKRNVWAIIEKEDYWNGENSFSEIEMP